MEDRRGRGYRCMGRGEEQRGRSLERGAVPHLWSLLGSRRLCLLLLQNGGDVAESLEEFMGVGTHRHTWGVWEG